MPGVPAEHLLAWPTARMELSGKPKRRGTPRLLDGSLPSLGNYWRRIEHMRPQLMGLARNEHERTLVRRAVDAVVRYLKEGVFEDPALGHSVMMAVAGL